MTDITNLIQQIDSDVKNNDVVLYMKGSALMPACGFSATVVHILNKMGVQFKDINALTIPNIREALKEYGDWPTLPQLYIKGELIGGCDITREMYQTGELATLLEEKGVPFSKQ